MRTVLRDTWIDRAKKGRKYCELHGASSNGDLPILLAKFTYIASWAMSLFRSFFNSMAHALKRCYLISAAGLDVKESIFGRCYLK